MSTENERRIYGHLLRVVSVLRLIELDHQRGHTAVGLESQLTAVRRYYHDNSNVDITRLPPWHTGHAVLRSSCGRLPAVSAC
jgi:hypothetical protein